MSVTSASTNYSSTRDLIITRALRICHEIGQGETANTTQLTESAQALNDLTKEWNATHGMPLWKIKTYTTFTLVAGTTSYTIGSGATINQVAPLKLLHAYLHDTSVSAAPRDIPLVLITKNQYDMLGDKTSQGYT